MKPTWRGVEMEGNGAIKKIITPDDDCTKCDNFTTQRILWPSGDCTEHKVVCGLGFTCPDFTDREEAHAHAKRKQANRELLRKRGDEIRKRMEENK